jgi:hypothetical protein
LGETGAFASIFFAAFFQIFMVLEHYLNSFSLSEFDDVAFWVLFQRFG